LHYSEYWADPGKPYKSKAWEGLTFPELETAGGRGIGVYYWEPCWIPSKPAWSVEHDNNWSHLTMFDFDGNKLDSLSVFKR
jgi:Arabinogalactan endo-1,4-beta-galactosidase